MNDPIERQGAIAHAISGRTRELDGEKWIRVSEVRESLQTMPSVQPEEKPISYADCANALMMMWIDNVLTDGEYTKIMDKLNAHEMKKREGE